MALCDTCVNNIKSYDEFRQKYDDTIIKNGDKRKKHYCPMNDDNIPLDIWYNNADCPYYIKRDGD